MMQLSALVPELPKRHQTLERVNSKVVPRFGQAC